MEAQGAPIESIKFFCKFFISLVNMGRTLHYKSIRSLNSVKIIGIKYSLMWT